jgi:hypothetical protein
MEAHPRQLFFGVGSIHSTATACTAPATCQQHQQRGCQGWQHLSTGLSLLIPEQLGVFIILIMGMAASPAAPEAGKQGPQRQ